MERKFWHDRWEAGQIGFHEGTANALFAAHFPALGLPEGARVFLPLCGKTRDIAWLLDRGYRVVGAELSGLAVDQLFDELGVTPRVQEHGALSCRSAPGLDIFVGDVFDLSAALLEEVDLVFDRAALVALPPDMRQRYAVHMIEVSGGAPQALIAFVYDQSVMDGPPHSVGAAEVQNLYGASHRISALETVAVPGLLRGEVRADETLWHLTRR